jgi:hydroxypyruvate reductase
MAHAVEALWPADAPLSGMVVTRYGHTPARPEGVPERLKIVEASHPVPDAAGLAAAEEILSLTQGLTQDDLVLCLISGGGSALLTLPADGLSLAEKQAINQALLKSGANIGEMNCVRKHLSRIKGGRLAAACAPAQVVTLAISDVPGDDPSVIASGPTEFNMGVTQVWSCIVSAQQGATHCDTASVIVGRCQLGRVQRIASLCFER